MVKLPPSLAIKVKMRVPFGFRLSHIDETASTRATLNGSYIWRWLAAEYSGPDQRRHVLLESYVSGHADLPLIVSDRYVLSRNIGIRTNLINVTSGQVVVSSPSATGGVSARIVRITGE